MAYLNRIQNLEWAGAIRAQSYQGKVYKRFVVAGRRTSFTGTSAYEDLAEFLTGTVLPTPTGAESWEVVSASANDASAGTGVRTVQIHYLDNSWLPQVTTVTLNGLTPVSVAALANCQAIQWMHSLTVGSGGVAAGNISLRIASAGATHERIAASENQSLSCRYTIPDGYYGIVNQWGAGMATAHSAQVLLRATSTRWTGTLASGVFLFQDIKFLNSNSDEESGASLSYPARTQIKISAIASNVGADIAGSIHIALFQV